MRPRSLLALALSCAACGSTLASCGGDTTSQIRSVPADHTTIQAAVDAANSGDVIVIAPGTYNEAVKVAVDNITIRGQDRNTVILDGEHSRANGFYVGANGVAIENLTTRNYTQNGVVFNGIEAASQGKGVDPAVEYGREDTSLVGYAARWVTSYNNGLYGIYAFAARDGVIEDSYVSGHPDSGIYIGQCNPCRAVVQRVTAELNAIGYYGTNASGDVWVINSTFRRNRLGIAPNSQQMEKLAPQFGATVAGNLVVDNDDPAAPVIPDGFFGGGIAIGGGGSNVVVRNRVEGHDFAGIVLTSMNPFQPKDNRIEENVAENNTIDLLWAPRGATGADGNCFAGNTFAVSRPARIETRMPCTGVPDVSATDVVDVPFKGPSQPVDYKAIPHPPAQPSMPVANLAASATTPSFVVPSLASISVPTR